MKYLKNTSWLLFEKVARMFVGLVVGVLMARYLGADQFGIFNYALSFVAIFGFMVGLGLDSIVVRELVRDEARTDEILGTSFLMKLSGALLQFFFILIVVHVIPSESVTRKMVLIIAVASLFQSLYVIDFFFQAQVKSRFVVYTSLINLVSSSLIKVFLILQHASLIWFALVVVYDSLMIGVGYVCYYRINKRSIFHWRPRWAMAKSLFSDSWPLLLSAMVVIVYMRTDILMLKHMLGNEAVGHYAAAVRISEAWYFIPMVITNSLFPAIINARSIDLGLYHDRLRSLFSITIWFSLAISVPVVFISEWAIISLYGPEYIQAGNVLMIHIWTGIPISVGVVSSGFWIAENLQKTQMIFTIIGLILNILLNLVFIRLYGVTGAALATLLSYLATNYLLLHFFRPTRKLLRIIVKSIYTFRLTI